MVPENGEVEMEVKLEVKMEVEMEVEMDGPILQPNYTWAQPTPVYIDGQIGASISPSIWPPIWPPFRPSHFQVPLATGTLMLSVD